MRTNRSMLRAAAMAGALLLVGAGWAPAPAPFEGGIAVGVGELGTGTPIQGAEVRIMELRVFKHTNWMGEVKFGQVPPGVWLVRVRKGGYAQALTQVVVGSGTVGPVFMLERLAVPDSVAKPVSRPNLPATTFERHGAGGS